MSKPSWRKIPYGTRPAKHIERKMIAEALSRLDAIHPLAEWRYVGLGSLWFTDFALFHRRLGIQRMHSIEDEVDPELQKRFRLNAPFSTQLHFGKTTSTLAGVPWDRPTIVWLDYDDIFRQWMLQDIDHVVASCQSPTVLIVTVNVTPGQEEGRRDRFIDQLGSEDRLPVWAKRDADLGGELKRRGMGNVVREIMTDQIQAALIDRGDRTLKYEQVLHFRYADGAAMLTFGGVLSTNESLGGFSVQALPFYRDADSPLHIDVPVVTLREGLQLEAMLPDNREALPLPGISLSEMDAFKILYRYMPSFVDVDL